MAQFCQSLISISHSTSSAKTDQYSLHCHPFCEIYYFISGDVDYLVEGVYYHPEPDSLLLLAPGTFHGFRANSAALYERFTVHFDPQIISAALQETLLSTFFSAGIYVRQARAYLPYITGLENCASLPSPVSDECAQANLLSLLGQLRVDRGETTPPAVSSHSSTLTQQVISYLSLNLAQPNTLDSLAKRFFVSRSHLSRAFMQETGASVAEYIRRKRLIYADTLRRQGMSATEAALTAGFGDYSTYYRTARREQTQMGKGLVIEPRISS